MKTHSPHGLYRPMSNSKQAIAVQSNIEKRLVRDKILPQYDFEMKKAITECTVVKRKNAKAMVLLLNNSIKWVSYASHRLSILPPIP